MKNLPLFTLAGLLATTSATAAEINCAQLPTCGSLGYTDKVSDCTNVNEILRYPFDSTVGKCLHKKYEPHVGDVKYSLYSSNHDGWLLCDGSQYSQTTYKKLYDVIGTNFCKTYSSRTDSGTDGKCGSGKFAVPDYRGFFLRGYRWINANAIDANTSHAGYAGISRSIISNALWYKGNPQRWSSETSYTTMADELYIPEEERLPNITGSFSTSKQHKDGIAVVASGAFVDSGLSGASDAIFWGDKTSKYNRYSFNASKSNTIYYGDHVTPANYATYIFIYAGK